MPGCEEQQDRVAARFDLMFIDPPTHSRSKRMEDDFDVQRDHVATADAGCAVLAPDGVIVFSNNYTRFKLDRDGVRAFAVEDITAAHCRGIFGATRASISAS